MNRLWRHQRRHLSVTARENLESHQRADVQKHPSLLATKIYGTDQQESSGKARIIPLRPMSCRNQATLLLSCHGGAGSTTLAINMGDLLAQAGLTACVIDLDFQFGEVLSSLNLKPRHSISDLIGGLDQLSRDFVLTRLPRHQSGLFVLSQVGDIDGLENLTLEGVSRLLTKFKNYFDCLLIDGVRDFNDYALAALDLSDSILLVASQDLPSLRGLITRLGVIKRMGINLEQIHVVLNRHSGTNPLLWQAIAPSLEVNLDYVVRNDFKVVSRSYRQGKTISKLYERKRISRDIKAMTESLFDLRIAPEKRKWLRSIFRRRQ